MTTDITLLTLAKRFRSFTFDNPEPESFSIYHENNNSRGNRYINWKSVRAKRAAEEGDTVIDKERLYKEVTQCGCDWWHLFDGIHYGLITGTKTLAALEECLEILRNDVIPENDGNEIRHVNSLGGVNYLDKSTFHNWILTDKLGKIMSTAFFEDRKDQTLYSEEFIYTYSSHSGWSRSC